MKKTFAVIAASAALSVSNLAYAVGNNYDMSHFLNQPHPFLAQPQAVSPAAQPMQMQPKTAMPAATRAKRSDSTPPAPQMAAKPSKSAGTPWGGFVSEVRIGALAHDTGPFSSNKESGIDTNLEVLFASPDFLDVIWAPRPQLGVTYNSAGDTSQAYLGLEWEYGFWDGWFASFSFGGAVHDGHLVGDKGGKTDQKSLGCRFLFREALNLGYRFEGRHAVMLHFDHISNASLCEKEVDNKATGGRHTVTLNEGLETVGLRYGYLF